MKYWGYWLAQELELDGVRLDAVKHINADYMREWLRQKECGLTRMAGVISLQMVALLLFGLRMGLSYRARETMLFWN